MFQNRTPFWVLAGGGGLACIAGLTNAVGFLGAYHQAFSHLSGTATFLATDLVQGRFREATLAALLLVAFLGGATLSGLIIRESHLRAGRRYGVALVIEGGLLVLAAVLLLAGHSAGALCAAAACGLQNAMATSYSGAIVRTTHVTGIVTDLGLALSHRLRGAPGRGGRARLLCTLLGGFVLGSAIGAFTYSRWGYAALYLPASICTTAGTMHFIRQHRRRNVRRSLVTPAK